MTDKRRKPIEDAFKALECRCLRCQHVWTRKFATLPLVCSKCKSPYWNRPRKGR